MLKLSFDVRDPQETSRELFSRSPGRRAAGRLRYRQSERLKTATSLALDVRCLDDWRPAGNFALHQRGGRLLASFGLGRYVAADVEQTLELDL
jgi:hypothetical protein